MYALLLSLALSTGTCSTDAECVLRKRCSCECCKVDEAMTKAEAEAERRRCMAVGPCGPKEGCGGAKCAAEKPQRAVCQGGKCAKAPK
ncbi:MAG: hypothetical protein JNK82_30345 [Myxococcaceae bacterium]|nr:hypothetical protein [Myxococcaceae bacterium]